jgi:Galactose mutarotase and related enzymes
MKKLFMLVVTSIMMLSCTQTNDDVTLSGLKKSAFDATVDGKAAALYVLTNKAGAEACITNFGGRLVSMMVPDREGKMTDVVLGYDNITDYLEIDGNYGATIGRFGNRIAKGKFTLDGTEYTLALNNNGNSLHGGPTGYHNRMWDAKQVNNQTLELTYLSVDGEEGFPGNLNIKVTYKLTDDNAIEIVYEATTDKATVINLTNHSYFNLSGNHEQKITDHLISINADSYIPVDATLIPTGEIASVNGTPMDLRSPIAVGARIDEDFEQLAIGRGYDHCWVLNTNRDIAALAAKVVSPSSGIALEVYTNEPGIQLYAGNMMSLGTGKHGTTYNKRQALCLETQHYPDSPNQPNFPSTVLRPGEKYFSRCVYKFTVE